MRTQPQIGQLCGCIHQLPGVPLTKGQWCGALRDSYNVSLSGRITAVSEKIKYSWGEGIPIKLHHRIIPADIGKHLKFKSATYFLSIKISILQWSVYKSYLNDGTKIIKERNWWNQ